MYAYYSELMSTNDAARRAILVFKEQVPSENIITAGLLPEEYN